MATLRLVNNTAADLLIADVGITMPPSVTIDFTDAGNIRRLIMSLDLRTLVTAGSITLSDGVNPITVLDLYPYWLECGFNTTKANPPFEIYIRSPDNTAWKITITNLGILVTSPV